MSLRLAFNCGRWQPTMDQFITALSMIQPAERLRICDFVFQRDVKSALVGRLLIRRAIRNSLGLKNEDIVLDRTKEGRPYLVNQGFGSFDFNISHDDNLVVLASEDSKHVGIDTMSIERPVGSRSVDHFFKLMKRQFTDNEWKWLTSNASNEKEKLSNFYRIWCMKESYVKAVGDGIGFSLSRIECCVEENVTKISLADKNSNLNANNRTGKDQTERSEGVVNVERSIYLRDPHVNGDLNRVNVEVDENCNHVNGDCNPVITSSYVKIDCKENKGWQFEETILLGNYLVCVAVQNLKENQASNPDPPPPPQRPPLPPPPPSFKFLTIDQLLDYEKIGKDGFESYKCQFIQEWNCFIKKDLQPNRIKWA